MSLNPHAKLVETILDIKSNKHKSIQDIQDDIFLSMLADRKIKVASGLWRLAKELDHEKIDYRIHRPKALARASRARAHQT